MKRKNNTRLQTNVKIIFYELGKNCSTEKLHLKESSRPLNKFLNKIKLRYLKKETFFFQKILETETFEI